MKNDWSILGSSISEPMVEAITCLFATFRFIHCWGGLQHLMMPHELQYLEVKVSDTSGSMFGVEAGSASDNAQEKVVR